IVLRSTVDSTASFVDLLGRVRDTVLDAFANDETPFDEVVEALRVPRDASRNPLFDVLVVLRDERPGRPRFAGLRADDVPVRRHHATFDLTVEFLVRDGGLRARLEYSTDLFDEVTVERLASHLQAVLAAVAAGPDRPVADLVALPPADR